LALGGTKVPVVVLRPKRGRVPVKLGGVIRTPVGLVLRRVFVVGGVCPGR